MMLSPHRLGLWSLVVGLLFLSGSNHVATAQETEAVVESGRRQLWDFWSLLAMSKSSVNALYYIHRTAYPHGCTGTYTNEYSYFAILFLCSL